MDELGEKLTQLEETLRQLMLQIRLFAVEVSSLGSDVRVIEIPRSVVPFERQEVSNN